MHVALSIVFGLLGLAALGAAPMSFMLFDTEEGAKRLGFKAFVALLILFGLSAVGAVIGSWVVGGAGVLWWFAAPAVVGLPLAALVVKLY